MVGGAGITLAASQIPTITSEAPKASGRDLPGFMDYLSRAITPTKDESVRAGVMADTEYRMKVTGSAIGGFTANLLDFIPGVNWGTEIREPGAVSTSVSTSRGKETSDISISGGNQTITQLGAWIDANREGLDRYDTDAVDKLS